MMGIITIESVSTYVLSLRTRPFGRPCGSTSGLRNHECLKNSLAIIHFPYYHIKKHIWVDKLSKAISL